MRFCSTAVPAATVAVPTATITATAVAAATVAASSVRNHHNIEFRFQLLLQYHARIHRAVVRRVSRRSRWGSVHDNALLLRQQYLQRMLPGSYCDGGTGVHLQASGRSIFAGVSYVRSGLSDVECESQSLVRLRDAEYASALTTTVAAHSSGTPQSTVSTHGAASVSYPSTFAASVTFTAEAAAESSESSESPTFICSFGHCFTR